MKKVKKLFLMQAVFFISAVYFAAAEPINEVRIDYKLDTAKENYETNYFNWTKDNGETIKDKFDVKSGASIKGSTKAFNAVRYSEPAADKKAAIPQGLRSLFLFALCDRKIAESHALQVSQKQGVITVRFIRKGTAYELKTDKKGNFNLLTSSKCAKDIAEKSENGFMIKSAYIKKGGEASKMQDLDWSKIKFTGDTYNPEAAYHYEGILKFTLENNILSISGTMKRK